MKVSELQAGLADALDKVQEAKKVYDETSAALEKASAEYGDAVNAAVKIRKDLDEVMNALLPDMGRVRMST